MVPIFLQGIGAAFQVSDVTDARDVCE